MKRIDHQQAYSMDGACTNMAEEFFSRMRRAEIGHHHHIAGAYLCRCVICDLRYRGHLTEVGVQLFRTIRTNHVFPAEDDTSDALASRFSREHGVFGVSSALRFSRDKIGGSKR
jgi:hypothetical protein